MPTSIVPPDLRRILADLTSRLGILERRITPRAPVTAAGGELSKFYVNAASFYDEGGSSYRVTWDRDSIVATGTTDVVLAGGEYNLSIMTTGLYSIEFEWSVLLDNGSYASGTTFGYWAYVPSIAEGSVSSQKVAYLPAYLSALIQEPSHWLRHLEASETLHFHIAAGWTPSSGTPSTVTRQTGTATQLFIRRLA